jgi:hypothetical protein
MSDDFAPTAAGDDGGVTPRATVADPRGRGKASGRSTAAIVVLGTATTVFALAAVVTAILGFGVMALLLAGTALVWSIPFCQRLFGANFVPRAATGPTGTTLRTAAGYDRLAATMALAAVASGGAWVAVGTMAGSYLPLAVEVRRVFMAGSAGLAAVCAAYLAVIAKNRGVGYLRLTPDGFVLAEAFWTSTGRWSDVIAVTNAAPVRPYGMGPFKTELRESYAQCSITVELANGRTAALSNAENYATDGNALRELVRFYWQHPEQRIELSDGRALERLSATATSARSPIRRAPSGLARWASSRPTCGSCPPNRARSPRKSDRRG